MVNDVLYIVIIYGITREQSRAWQSLKACLPADVFARDVYMHDNTGHNVFLAQAYNEGLAYATSHGYQRIALFDADACPTKEYIDAVCAVRDERAVWAPTLADERGKVLSPKRLWGIPVAFNSGLVLPVGLMNELGGFNTDYPLDYLDHRLCYDLQQHQIPLRTLPVTLTHSLSVEDYTNVSRERYLSVLAAEKRFAKETGHISRYRCLLGARLIKWALTRHPFVRETFNALRER